MKINFLYDRRLPSPVGGQAAGGVADVTSLHETKLLSDLYHF
jgi:hypothetical protein